MQDNRYPSSLELWTIRLISSQHFLRMAVLTIIFFNLYYSQVLDPFFLHQAAIGYCVLFFVELFFGLLIPKRNPAICIIASSYVLFLFIGSLTSWWTIATQVSLITSAFELILGVLFGIMYIHREWIRTPE